MRTFPMQVAWLAALALVPLLSTVALALGAAELSGAVARGAWIGEASDGERWAAVVVGALLLPFGLTALRHARLTIDATELRHLGFGVVCNTRTLAFSEIRRWGRAVATNRGRREPMLLFELRDGSRRTIKLAMYARQAEIVDELTRKLGPAAPASGTLTGIAFDE